MRMHSRFLVLGVGLMAVLAACSSTGGSSSPAASVAPSAAAPSVEASAPAAGGTTVAVARKLIAQGRIKPDDRAIYESDGFSVESYEADGGGFAKRGIAAYKPVLTRFPSFPATARADSGSEDT